MAKKEFVYRGKTFDEIKSMSIDEFAKLLPARERRSLLRLSPECKKLLNKVEKKQKNIKTHAREAVIIPIMVGQTIMVHKGSEFIPVQITQEMIGHRLGELVLTRKRVQHSAPGIGATKSSASLSVK